MKKLKDFILLVKKELLICIAVPILTAVLLNTSATQNKDFFLFTIVGLFCIFAYGVIKMFFTLKKKDMVMSCPNKPKSTRYRVFVFITAVILPIMGLWLNNANIFLGGNGGIFGDFSNTWFYIIAILNGIIMYVEIKDNKLGVMLFYLKIAGFTYITYFTIIFMPILPYGFIGLIFYGLGALIFVPITVFVTEIFQILQDIRKLKTKFKVGIIIAAILGAGTIPIVMAVSFSFDKVNFNNALTYLSAESQEMSTVNISRLETTLIHINNVRESWQGNVGIFDSGTSIPVISKFYQVVALDDKIISLDTSERLSQIFLGSGDQQPINSDTDQFQNLNIINSSVSTEYDEQSRVYKTWVDLEIRNDSDSSLAEYRTEFQLPDGCFIKDYYLYVGTERKQGILADKRAALITYNNIIRTPKDPGIIYYKNDDTIELRVYPFNGNQVRKTGFLVLHSQNEIITIDGKEINLPIKKGIDEPINMQGVSFIPYAAKSGLPVRERTPKYYFIIDASENSPYDEHLKKVQEYVQYYQIMNAEVYAASYKVYDTNKSVVKCEGGFNLPLAMEMIFKEDLANDLGFPIIIAVSDNINKAPAFQKSNMAKKFPESYYYYNLGYDLTLTPYSFSDNLGHDIVKSPILTKALDCNGLLVSDNEKSEIVFNGEFGDYTDNEYHNAFILYGKSSANNNDNSIQVELVRDSFRQRILTKYTAFTVLETKEQENALLELQAKFLNNDGKDAPAVMMDEPSLFICLLLVLAFVFYKGKGCRGSN